MAVSTFWRLSRPLPIVAGLLVVAAGCMAHAGSTPKKNNGIQGATDRALSDYIARVRQQSEAEPHTMGSIWSDDGAFTRLASDVRAMHTHDLVSIVVVEALSASTDGSVKNSRASSANSQITSLFAKLSASNSLQNLVSQNSASALTAQGQSVTNSSLNTTVGGQVVSVLPNGILVIKAERQVTFNQQMQMIRLRGLVRPSDVNATIKCCLRPSLILNWKSLERESSMITRTAKTLWSACWNVWSSFSSSSRIWDDQLRCGLLVLAAASAPCFASAQQIHDATAHRVRIKDVGTIEGVRENQLIGYGIVVGLSGTGDSQQTVFPVQTLPDPGACRAPGGPACAGGTFP